MRRAKERYPSVDKISLIAQTYRSLKASRYDEECLKHSAVIALNFGLLQITHIFQNGKNYFLTQIELKTRHHLSGWLYIYRFFIVKLIRGFSHLQAIKTPSASINACLTRVQIICFWNQLFFPLQFSNYTVNPNINYGYLKRPCSFKSYDWLL